MLPRWHVLYGALFALLLAFFAPNAGWINITLVFFSSFLIDFDHYIVAVIKNKSWNLKKSFGYYKLLEKIEIAEKKRGIQRRGDFFIFHTIEFNILIALLGLIWEPFFYIFLGMVFHSLLDVYDLLKRERIYRREYFFFNWLSKRL